LGQLRTRGGKDAWIVNAESLCEELHHAVNLLCFARKSERRKEFSARESGKSERRTRTKKKKDEQTHLSAFSKIMLLKSCFSTKSLSTEMLNVFLSPRVG